jgi:hypothetical protein
MLVLCKPAASSRNRQGKADRQRLLCPGLGLNTPTGAATQLTMPEPQACRDAHQDYTTPHCTPSHAKPRVWEEEHTSRHRGQRLANAGAGHAVIRACRRRHIPRELSTLATSETFRRSPPAVCLAQHHAFWLLSSKPWPFLSAGKSAALPLGTPCSRNSEKSAGATKTC